MYNSIRIVFCLESILRENRVSNGIAEHRGEENT